MGLQLVPGAPKRVLGVNLEIGEMIHVSHFYFITFVAQISALGITVFFDIVRRYLSSETKSMTLFIELAYVTNCLYILLLGKYIVWSFESLQDISDFNV